MADIVNLRRHRKHKSREAAAQQAATNRVAFGRTKSEREAIEVDRARERRSLDGHRLEGDPADRTS